MNIKTIMIGMLVLVTFSMSTALADNQVYFDPEISSVDACGNNAIIQLKLDATDGIAVWGTDIKFDSTCVDIIDVDFTDSPYTFMPKWEHKGDYIKASSMILGDTITGDGILLATLTVRCDCIDDCESSLVFTNNTIGDDGGNKKPATWIPGTVKCGDPVEERTCLGDCLLNATGAIISTNVPCYECIVAGGPNVTWINYPCTGDGCTCDSREWGTCPQCCDGVDNDGNNATDWPLDDKCGCCIDGNETNGDDPCPLPCIPELPTLAFMSIGILGMFLLVRKRG